MMNTNAIFKVVAIGFSRQEVSSINQMFTLINNHEQYQYQLLDKVDMELAQLAIVNADDAEVVKNWRVWNARSKPLLSIYAYTYHPPRGAKVAIQKPLTTALLQCLQKATDLSLKTHTKKAVKNHWQQMNHVNSAVFSQLQTSHHKTALVIEDSSSLLKPIYSQLNFLGIATETVNNGEMALKVIDDKRYDIVFIDTALPGMGGYEVCKSIRGSFRHNDVAICMLTEKSKVFQVVRAKLAGSDRCVSKPIIADELSNTVAELLRIDFNRSLKIA